MTIVCALVGEGLGVALVDSVSASDHRHLSIVSRTFRPRVMLSTWFAEPREHPRSQLTSSFLLHLERKRSKPAL